MRLSELRKDIDLTQQQIAEYLAVNKIHISSMKVKSDSYPYLL